MVVQTFKEGKDMSAKDWDAVMNFDQHSPPKSAADEMRTEAHRREVAQEVTSRREAELRAGAKHRAKLYEDQYNRRVTERLRAAGQIRDDD